MAVGTYAKPRAGQSASAGAADGSAGPDRADAGVGDGSGVLGAPGHRFHTGRPGGAAPIHATAPAAARGPGAASEPRQPLGHRVDDRERADLLVRLGSMSRSSWLHGRRWRPPARWAAPSAVDKYGPSASGCGLPLRTVGVGGRVEPVLLPVKTNLSSLCGACSLRSRRACRDVSRTRDIDVFATRFGTDAEG